MTISELLKLEWMKMRSYLLFRIIAAFYLIFLPATLLITKSMGINSNEIGVDTDTFLMFPNVWNYLAYAGNWIAFFIFGFLGVTQVTNEYSDRTLRQNIICGMTRDSYFLAKLVFVLALAIVATMYYILVCLALGFLFTETIYWSKVWQESGMIPRYFIMCLAYLSFGLLLGMLLRRTAIATIVYFIYVFFFEPVWRWGVHYQLIKNVSPKDWLKTMHFYPMNIVEDLAPTPLPAMVKGMTEEFDFPIFIQPSEAVIGGLIYIVLFLLASRWLLKKRDL